MSRSVTRRGFLGLLGIGAGVAVASPGTSTAETRGEQRAPRSQPLICPECGGALAAVKLRPLADRKAGFRCPRCCW
ncbi:MAG: twin-arginine translocation signal domain-containing protein [Planctomycetes bacterium]|nr:twin-arginine translocation signal domain-containing protein [Planctomycetota bacterium]